MTHLRKSYLAILLAGVAACSDAVAPQQPEDPCAPVYACRSTGVDLVVIAFEVSAPRIDSETGLGIIEPDHIPVRYVIRNIGSVTSNPAQAELAFVCCQFEPSFAQIPAIAPGAEYRDSVVIQARRTSINQLTDDRLHLGISIWNEPETNYSDNSLNSGKFHLAVPLVHLSLTTVAKATLGDRIPLTITARNYGLHAAAPAQALTACLFDYLSGCDPRFRTTTSGFVLPTIPPGSAIEFSTDVDLLLSTAWQDAAVRYSITICDPPPGGTPGYFINNQRTCYGGSRSIDIEPNYAACAPPLLTMQATVTFASYNCGLRPGITGFEQDAARYRFHLAGFDANAGETYTVQRSDSSAVIRLYHPNGLPASDFDPAPNRIRLADSGRIYLVMYSLSPSLTAGVTKVQQ